MSRTSPSQFLDHLRELVRSGAIRELHVDEKTATALALNLVAQISDAWGGINVYISQRVAREIQDRVHAVADCSRAAVDHFPASVGCGCMVIPSARDSRVLAHG